MPKGYIIRFSKQKFMQYNIIFGKEAGREAGEERERGVNF